MPSFGPNEGQIHFPKVWILVWFAYLAMGIIPLAKMAMDSGAPATGGSRRQLGACDYCPSGPFPGCALSCGYCACGMAETIQNGVNTAVNTASEAASEIANTASEIASSAANTAANAANAAANAANAASSAASAVSESQEKMDELKKVIELLLALSPFLHCLIIPYMMVRVLPPHPSLPA